MWKLYYHPPVEHKAWVVDANGVEALVSQKSIEYWTLEDREVDPPNFIFDSSEKDQPPYKYGSLVLHQVAKKAEELNMRDYGKPY